MTNKQVKPRFYPDTANSGIYDAQAFTVGKGTTVHKPARFPDGNKVTARCGVYAWVCERETRLAHWADGYSSSQTVCKACF